MFAIYVCLVQTAGRAGKRPLEQFAVSFFADYLFKEETSEFSQDRVLLN